MDKPLDLDALDQLHAAATPGEWSVEVEEYGASGCVAIPEINRNFHDTEWADPLDFERDQSNAAAIAALHNAYPEIAEEIRTLRQQIGMIREYNEALRQERDTIRAEAARLREALECVPVDLIHAIENGDTGANVFLSTGSCKLIGAALNSTPATAQWLAARDAEMKRIGAAEWLEANNDRLDVLNRADVAADSAKAEITRLQAKLAEAREDSERLDAAQQAGWTIGPLDAIKPRGAWTVIVLTAAPPSRHYYGKTARAAIDAARKGEE
jgi:hypothetical protein